MEESILWQIVLQIVLIVSNAIFACAEIAVISVNSAKLEQLTAQGDRRAGRLKKLTDNPATFLATIQVAITLSGFLASAFAADNFSSRLVEVFVSLGVPLPRKTLGTISVVIITLILSYITLIFGELVPKRVAMKKAEQLALAMSSMISFIAKICAPLVWLLTVSTNGVLRLIGIDPKADDEEVGEEDIRLMVDAGSRSGTIDEEDKEMIQNIFEFDDLPVGEFATHRRDVAMLWMEDSAEAWKKTINDTRFSNYPICDESVDNVIGVLKAKEYFRLRDKTRENVMKNAVVPPCFVPEGVRADVLFKRMKQTRDHFAIVLDEQGGVSGIVTMNDLLEQLVGDLDDENAQPQESPEIEKIDENKWEIKGSAPLEEVAEELGVTLPVDEYDTFGGFVFASYGSVPDDGTTFKIEAEGLDISVAEITDHRIEKASVSVIKNPEKEDEVDGEPC